MVDGANLPLNEITDEIGKDADRLPIKCWT